MTALSVLIPANDEAGYIDACLAALLASEADPRLDAGQGEGVEIIVAANACSDDTVALALAHAPAFAARGWRLEALDIVEGGKLNALNRAEAAAQGGALVYLDADVTVSPALLPRLLDALDRPEPAYATGRIKVARARTWITRAYARLWIRLPFVQNGAVGAGLFAMNQAGRARWGVWPRIISDDTFARLHFAPEERHEVDAVYIWPMVEGFRALVKVRRRQDAGVTEVCERFPELSANEAHGRIGKMGMLRLLRAAPVAFCVYVSVALVVRFGAGKVSASGHEWSRGR
jgi:glycosyltransferase involved in cell wall biosynthesis